MRKNKKVIAATMVATLLCTSFLGCGGSSDKKDSKDTTTTSNNGGNTSTTAPAKIREYDLFVTVAGQEVPEDNRILKKITEKIGAKANVTWLTGQTDKERVGVMIAGGIYPDMIVGSNATPDLIAADALVPLDDLLDKYPNIKNFWSEEEWNMVKGAGNGAIYYIPIFGNANEKSMLTRQNDEAFWIQKRVLKWADYPTITTVDQYFDLVQDYLAANPADDEGQKNIGFEILCDDWRWFCLENVPQFLAGYPNDGAAIVDMETGEAHNYDDIPEAEAYYRKLNEMYNAGVVDPETFTLSHDQYIAKLSTGRVLGMVDQGWDFLDAETSLIAQGKYDCTYVSLALTLEEGQPSKYFTPNAFNSGDGIAITKSCKDVEGALQMLNDLLDNDIMVLRNWGEEGIDYEVGEDGKFYRTEEQRANAENPDYINQNCVNKYYGYIPCYEGMLFDGINTVWPSQQPEEFQASLKDIDKEVLSAYGHNIWTDFLPYTEDIGPWYPIYTAKNTWEASSDAAIAAQKMEEVKREWLPKVIMSKEGEFDKTWNKYMDIYHKDTNYKVFEDKMTEEALKKKAIADGTYQY